jgi:fibronectin-binding autotransporter adhesin
VKKIFFNRKQILHAIHAAAVALFLWVTQQQAAQAQSYTPPFVVNGGAVTTSSGTFGTGSGLYEAGAGYTSATIGAGTTITSSASYVSPFTPGGVNSTLFYTSASTFSNAGTISLTMSASGTYQAPIYLDQGALSLVASNSGSISSIVPFGSQSSALFLNSTSGNLTITNTGSLYSNGSNSCYGLRTQSSAGGNISITNSQSGSITVGNQGGPYVGAYANAQGGGTIDFTNAGTISGPAEYGAYLQSDTGSIQGSNSGTISGAETGMYGFNAGSVTLSNSGTITDTVSGLYAAGTTCSVTNTGSISGGNENGMEASVSLSATIQNSGTVSSSYAGLYVVQGGGVGVVQVQNTGHVSGSSYGVLVYAQAGTPITITNSGSIVSSAGFGIFLSQPGSVMNSGSISGATAAISVPSGSSVTLSGNAAVTGTIQGGATSASTSTLTFNLAIPAAQLAAAQAQLATEIAAYNAQNGGAYTFDIDGKTFDILNFLYGNGGITDDLVLPAVTRMYANTPGYQSMGSVLDTLPTNAVSTNLLTALNNVPDSGVAAALAELSPKELQIFRNVAFDNNTFNVANVNNHLANLRDGLTGFDDSQMTVRDGSMDPSLNQVRSHLLAFNPAPNSGLINDSADSILGGMEMKDTRVNTMPTDRWSSFISGDVILADTSHNTNLDDADYTTGNVTGGLDYRLDQHFTVGALFAYAHTDANLDSRGSSATVDSYSPGIYASYVDGGWYGNALGAYTRNAYTEDRQIDITGLAGDNHGATSGNQGSVNLTGGYEFQKGSFKFGPVASVQYVHLAIDSMQEDGPTALSIASQDQDSFRSLLGFEGRFSTKVATCNGPMILTPHVSASWQHEYLDNSQGINADFTGTGGGSFTTETDTPDRDSAFVDVGLDATVAKNVTLFVDYEAQAGQENFFAQSARGGVKIGF